LTVLSLIFMKNIQINLVKSSVRVINHLEPS